MLQYLIGQVSVNIHSNDIGIVSMVTLVDEEIQLDELDALKADLLSLQASVHKLVYYFSLATL